MLADVTCKPTYLLAIQACSIHLHHLPRRFAQLGLSEKTVRKYFRDELDHGAERVRSNISSVWN